MPASLPEATRQAIRDLIALGGTQPDVAALTGVSRAAVDRVVHGRSYGTGRVHPHQWKLDADRVREIRARAADGNVSNCALAREYNVTETTIRSIVQRRTWKDID